MRSYRIHSTVVIEEKAAAKEKNNRLLKEYFSPLAAKEKKYVNNQRLLQGVQKKEDRKIRKIEDRRQKTEDG